MGAERAPRAVGVVEDVAGAGESRPRVLVLSSSTEEIINNIYAIAVGTLSRLAST